MLKQDLVYKQKDCLGLDIGATSVKVVQLKKKKNLTKLVGYGALKLPENLVIEGIISDHKEMFKLLKQLMSEVQDGRFTAEKVIASIPDANCFTKVLEFPEMTEKELKEAVLWEADQSIPMALTDLVCDWQVLGPSPSKDGMNDVLLVAAPLAIVNSYVQLFEIMKLQPEAIETSLASVTRALVSNKEAGEVMLVADIGAKSTNLGVYDTTLKFADSFEVAGDTFDNSIAASLKIDKEKAEKMKIKLGLHDKKINDALLPNLESLLTEMKRVVRYHDERSAEGRKLTKLILSGGSANIPGLTEYFTVKLGLQAKVGNPWVNIDTYPLKPVSKSESASYANAIGLSLKGMEGVQ